jgi:hypothetical protein
MKRLTFVLLAGVVVSGCDSGGGGGGAGGSIADAGGMGGGGGGAGGMGGAGGSPTPDMGVEPCTPGMEGCPCGPAAPCTGGRTCENGQCIDDLPMRGLTISDANARSCELYLIESGESRVANVRFADGVRGRFIRQAPAVAVAFVRQGDQPFAVGSVALEISGPANGVALRSATCANAAGATIENVTVTLQ